MEKNQDIMDKLVKITSPALGGDDSANPIGSSEGYEQPRSPASMLAGTRWDTRLEADPQIAREITGVELPTEWTDRFDLYLDTVRARWVKGGGVARGTPVEALEKQ